MPNYKYVALTPQGKQMKGTMEAANMEGVQNQLKSEGNTPLKVSEEGLFDKELNFSFGSSVKSRDLSIFCQQFVSIVEAGVSVVSALEMLGDQTENKTLKEAILNVKSSVEKGDTLANSMRNESVFPSLLVNMVDAGEASGSLEVAFRRMATQFEKDTKMKSMITKAMIYPIAILVVVIGVVIIMMAFVIPTFEDMFADMGSELPLMTRMIVAMSGFIVNKWYILILIVAAIVVAIKLFGSTETGKYFFADLKIKLPVFGNLSIKTASARFARTMSTLLAAGIPVMEALEITAKTMTNPRFKDAMYATKEKVAEGRPMSEPLKECNLFPSMIIHMVGIGEETGNIEHMLDTAANYFEEEVEAATEKVAAIIEPLIIVLMAVIVGGIVIAIMSPMMGMYDMAGGSDL